MNNNLGCQFLEIPRPNRSPSPFSLSSQRRSTPSSSPSPRYINGNYYFIFAWHHVSCFQTLNSICKLSLLYKAMFRSSYLWNRLLVSKLQCNLYFQAWSYLHKCFVLEVKCSLIFKYHVHRIPLAPFFALFKGRIRWNEGMGLTFYGNLFAL